MKTDNFLRNLNTIDYDLLRFVVNKINQTKKCHAVAYYKKEN